MCAILLKLFLLYKTVLILEVISLADWQSKKLSNEYLSLLRDDSGLESWYSAELLISVGV